MKNKSNKPRRMGRVEFKISYIVDLNDLDMVAKAKEFIWEDMRAAYLDYEEYEAVLDQKEDKRLTDEDIEESILFDYGMD